MKTKKLLSVIMAFVMVFGTVVTCIPFATTHVHAVNATAVTLTATDGSQTTLTEDAETATYSWVAETATLTLNGYSGRMISTNGDINLHLKGTNTLTMDSDATTGELHALELDGTSGLAQISADVGGTLDINGENLKTYFTVITGPVKIINGTIDIDVSTSSDGWLYGFNRNVSFANSGDAYENAPSKDAVINLNIERTAASNSFVYGFYNGMNIENRGNITVNATVAGSDNDTVVGFSDLYVYNASPKITMTVTNGEGVFSLRRAADGFQGISLTEGGRVELNGRVRAGSIQVFSNVNTVTTTPANNKYVWLDSDGSASSSSNFILSDIEGNYCEKTVFEYSEDPSPLDWVGGNLISVPAAKVDDSILVDILAGLRGANYYGGSTYYWKFEIIEGQLPPGLYIYNGGAIGGQVTGPCDAGTVTVRITDKNNSYNENDHRSIDVTISYGACADKDRYLTVGNDTPVEMKTNGSGTGWSYDASTKTLTLNGYNGGPISTDHYLNLHLDGENTITLTDEKNSGLLALGSAADITVTAEDDGVLNIVSDSLTKGFSAIESALYFKNGTINIDISSSFENGSEGYAIHGYFEAVKNITEKAEWNVKLKNTSLSASAALYGNAQNGICINDRDNVTFNVDLKGNENTALKGIYSLNLSNSNAKIKVSVDNNGGSSKCLAAEGINSLILKEGGSVDLTGKIQSGSLPYDVSPNTVTTTPANNAYFWYDINESYYYETFEMRDLSGDLITHAVFEYSAEPADLKWVGDGIISIPGGTVGDYAGINLWSAIRGSNYVGMGTYHWYFEILEGQLPTGLYLSNYNGKFEGQITAPCVAGKVRIRATDRAGTESNTMDDRSIEFDLTYGAYITNKPVSGITLDKDEITLDYGGTGDITATVTPSDAAYPNVTGMLVGGDGEVSINNISDPINGVSVITLKSWYEAGKYTVTIKTIELGLTKNVTVYVREATPNVSIGFIDERLIGFTQNYKYRISGEDITPVEFTAESSFYKIPDEWMGKTINVVQLHDGEEKCNSKPQVIDVPDRPNAPDGIGKTDASGAEAIDATITGVDTTMAYQKDGAPTWTYIVAGTKVESLGIGTYHVRYASTAEAFASKPATVVIGYGELAFIDSDSFDIPDGITETSTVVDLSSAVNGGKKPYVWSIEGPDWVTIDQNGKVTAVRPSEAQDATTATITVKDGDETTKSITINIGAVALLHICVFDQEKISDIYKIIDADCVNKAVYRYSCVCGEASGLTFTYGEAKGHDYTVKIEDAAHLKQIGASCKEKSLYWYECSVCGASAKDNPYASDKYFEGADVGDHLYGELIAATEAIHTKTELVAGIAAHYQCSVCDKYFTSTKVETTLQELTGATPSHSYGAWQTNDDKHWKECSCGLKSEENNHVYDDTTDVTCNTCNHDRTLPHTHGNGIKQLGQSATCTVPGWKDYYRCECGKYYEDADCQTPISDLEAWKVGAGKTTKDHEPNTDDGDCTTAITCSVCGTVTTAANATHTAGADDGDCTTAVKCTKCDKNAIEAKATHTGGTATCEHKAECTVCGKEYGNLANHIPNADDGDCTTAITCSVCGTVTTAANATHTAGADDGDCTTAVKCTKCNKNAIEANATHTGGTATCTAKATCSVCGKEYGSFGNHDYGTLIGAVAEKHTQTELVAGVAAHYQCSVCDKYFTSAKVETTLQKLTGATPSHSYGTWQTNNDKHWKECSCGLKSEENNHVYDNATDVTCNTCDHDRPLPHTHGNGVKQLGQSATCTTPGWNDYYKCSCGKFYTEADCTNEITDLEAWKTGAGKIEASHNYGTLVSAVAEKHTQTELVAGVAAHYHCSACGKYFTEDKVETTLEALTGTTPSHSYGDWKTDADKHWKECSCGKKADEGNHVDANSNSKCDSCDKTLSGGVTPPPHTHDYGTTWKSDGTNHWKECSCGDKKEVTAHSGGTATCEAKAKCSECNTEYGELAEHKYSEATCTAKAKCSVCGDEKGELAPHTPGADDGDCTTDVTCSACGTVTAKGADAHTGGTATCTAKAKCSECGKEYGELAAHKYSQATCTAKAKCSVCGDETGELAPHDYVDGKCACGATDPNYQPPHEHNFVEGKCECGETDPNYQPPHEHNFVEGKCECGETDPNYTPGTDTPGTDVPGTDVPGTDKPEDPQASGCKSSIVGVSTGFITLAIIASAGIMLKKKELL